MVSTSVESKKNSSAVRATIPKVVIRLAGDSGDGMQLTGSEFTKTAALGGNDIATFPDFPAEIRAPAGTLAGVSGFQLQFSSEEIFTPGDQPDVLVAMNPAAFRKNIGDVKRGGMVIANVSAFTKANLKKVGYEEDPLDDEVLADRYRIIKVDMGGAVSRALEGMDLSTKEIARTKNFWALGILYWLYNKDLSKQVGWIERKFAKKPIYAEANVKALKAGYAFGDTTELIGECYQVEKAAMEPGVYRNITGNVALVQGLVTAGRKANIPLVFGSYPITPASDILHNLTRYRHMGVTTFQAEDEIAAIGVAIGASYGGAFGICSTSGPGLALKGEALGFAHILELPLLVINVQRGGPSTGLPTKTEQSDLLQCLYGRNGEAPVPVIAASSPVDCFDVAIEAVRTAIKYMTPVLLMSDGYIANGAEPWKIPEPEDIPPIDVAYRTDPDGYQVYMRDPETGARPWVKPGTPGLEHRVGGLEKDFLSGEVSYEPENHERMIEARADKINKIQQDIPPCTVEGDDEGDVLLVGWGGTFGALRQAVVKERAQGTRVSHLHLRWIHPFAANIKDIFGGFKKIIVCELNKGQLAGVLRKEFLVETESYTKVQGQPFQVQEIRDVIQNKIAEIK
jgi:2-oxoglutarate/2-oxoacid ferredoxin oxidoreductase subunit alpha